MSGDGDNDKMSDAEWLGIKEEPVAWTTYNVQGTDVANAPVVNDGKYEKRATWGILLNFLSLVCVLFVIIAALVGLDNALSGRSDDIFLVVFYAISLLLNVLVSAIGIIFSISSFGKLKIGAAKRLLIIISLVISCPVLIFGILNLGNYVIKALS